MNELINPVLFIQNGLKYNLSINLMVCIFKKGVKLSDELHKRNTH